MSARAHKRLHLCAFESRQNAEAHQRGVFVDSAGGRGSAMTAMSSANTYYDMLSFLSEEERLPVVFNAGCTGLGFEFDSSCGDKNVRLRMQSVLHRGWSIVCVHPRGASVSSPRDVPARFSIRHHRRASHRIASSLCTHVSSRALVPLSQLPRGSNVSMPFWMVPKLSEQHMVAVKNPKCFHKGCVHVIAPDPPRDARAPACLVFKFQKIKLFQKKHLRMLL